MGFEVKKLEEKHILEVIKAKGNEAFKVYMTAEHIKTLVDSKNSYTVLIDGMVVLCAGVFHLWGSRGEAWAVIDSTNKRYWHKINRAIKRFLDVCELQRIEATVVLNFKAGHRWAKSFGFEVEAPLMRKYGPDGEDRTLYARVR